MNAPPPEKRKCESCFNIMTLNLFRLNSFQCRYCQDGISIPSRLINNSKDDESILEESKDDDSSTTDAYQSLAEQSSEASFKEEVENSS